MTVKAWRVADAYSNKDDYVEGQDAHIIDGAFVVTVQGNLWRAWAPGRWTYVMETPRRKGLGES